MAAVLARHRGVDLVRVLVGDRDRDARKGAAGRVEHRAAGSPERHLAVATAALRTTNTVARAAARRSSSLHSQFMQPPMSAEKSPSIAVGRKAFEQRQCQLGYADLRQFVTSQTGVGRDWDEWQQEQGWAVQPLGSGPQGSLYNRFNDVDYVVGSGNLIKQDPGIGIRKRSSEPRPPISPNARSAR